ncbi:alpha/beta hydrolase [Solwaraspora sp. WMMD1047]|uniref:alpha/beta hydrolase n=1 Tax=Solwaraspora sp. WMMD1047 TaxID=3016102 RepID=UPI0024165686|nr:alpha/beta hydrolase [Solwaraspora sp. WMMD1047]MDG4834245.1 alpha/beta hydrolase [Solwaraspora sp. WMMD1047]
MSGEELELLRELFEMHSTWREQPLSQRREYYERADAAFGGPGAAPGETVVVRECSAEWVLPFRPGGPVLLYFHGGSYTMGSAASHRHLVRELGEVCGGSALSVDYRRAPEAPFPAAVTDAVACYRYLLDRDVPSHRIILAGDSAGAGITVATMLALREAGVAQPAAGVCLSPWADLTCGLDSHRTRAARDPVLDSADLRRMAALYHAGTDPRHPQVSPAFADLSGLPPLLIQVGTEEVLFDDARALAAGVEAAGGSVRLEEWPDMFHVWHYYFPVLTEARAAIAAIGAFVTAVLADEPVDVAP